MWQHLLDGYFNWHNICIKQKYDRWCGSEHSFKMAEGNKKRFSAGEVIETIFTDEDSNDEDFDCRSDMEICIRQ